jgi:hypothetical protein
MEKMNENQQLKQNSVSIKMGKAFKSCSTVQRQHLGDSQDLFLVNQRKDMYTAEWTEYQRDIHGMFLSRNVLKNQSLIQMSVSVHSVSNDKTTWHTVLIITGDPSEKRN